MNNNQLEVIIPQEVTTLMTTVSAEKQKEVSDVLSSIFAGTHKWDQQISDIQIVDENDKMNISLAKTFRLNVRNARLSATKLIDAKRAEVQNLKKEYDVIDKLWLKTQQIVDITFKDKEEKARYKEETAERLAILRKDERTMSRQMRVFEFRTDIARNEYEDMKDETFDNFLIGLKKEYDEKVESLRKEAEEKERLDAIEILRFKRSDLLRPYYSFLGTKLDSVKNLGEMREQDFVKVYEEVVLLKTEHDEEQERIKLENQRLLKEKAEKDALIEKERLATIAREKKAKEEADKQLQKAKVEAEAKLKAEREATQKLQKELSDKKVQEEKLEKERLADIARKQKEKEDLEKAPIKKQLKTWIQDFNAPVTNSSHKVKDEILSKFESFKKWATSEIDKL